MENGRRLFCSKNKTPNLHFPPHNYGKLNPDIFLSRNDINISVLYNYITNGRKETSNGAKVLWRLY